MRNGKWLAVVVVTAMVLGLMVGVAVASEPSMAEVVVRVQDVDGNPIEGASVRYKINGTTYWFSPRYTDADGEVRADFRVGTSLSIQVGYNSTWSAWQTAEVVEGGNLFVFQPTQVTIAGHFRISYGGPTGQLAWFKNYTGGEATKDLFPGTYVVHFNGLGRINLPVSGDVMYLVENGIEYHWLPPVYEGMVITNRNANNPFKFQVVIAGYPIILDNYYDEEFVTLQVAGEDMDDLAYDPEKQEFKAYFKVRDYDLKDGEYTAEVFYDGASVSKLDFEIRLKR